MTLMFQLTRPRGTRLEAVDYEVVKLCFNSRVREGRDAVRRARGGSYNGFNSRVREGRDSCAKA